MKLNFMQILFSVISAELDNTSSQLYNCWHTDSQRILLAACSGISAYSNWFGPTI
jgi:hypothetical protein